MVGVACDPSVGDFFRLGCPATVQSGDEFEISVVDYGASLIIPIAVVTRGDATFLASKRTEGTETTWTTFTFRAGTSPENVIQAKASNLWSAECTVSLAAAGLSSSAVATSSGSPMTPANTSPTPSRGGGETLNYTATLDADKNGSSGTDHLENGTATLSLAFGCADSRCGGSFSLSQVAFTDGTIQEGVGGAFAYDRGTEVYEFAVDTAPRPPCAAVHWTGYLLVSGRDDIGPIGFNVTMKVTGSCGLASYQISYAGSATRS